MPGHPLHFRDLQKTLEETNADVKSTIELSRKFLADCPDTPATCSVNAILARHLMVRNARYREELENERRKELVGLGLSSEQITEAWPDIKTGIDAIMEGYLTEIENLCRSVVTECPRGSERSALECEARRPARPHGHPQQAMGLRHGAADRQADPPGAPPH